MTDLENRMTYSYTKVFEAIKLAKPLHVQCSRKNMHFANASEILNVYDKVFDLTQCSLFDTGDWSYIRSYFNAAYNFKNYSNKELNGMARQTVRYLQRELEDILLEMSNGEVNTID